MEKFKEIKDLAHKVIDELPLNVSVKELESIKILLKYYKYHPDFENKFHNGFKYFVKRKNPEWNNACIYILDHNNNYTALSKNFIPTTTDKEKESCLKALRELIDPIIKEKRKQFYKGMLCEISGLPINEAIDLHIDHHNVDFIEIVNKYLQLHQISYKNLFDHCKKENTKWNITHPGIVKDFIKFHNENTTLRFTFKTENLKKPKAK
jgi:hypothetical protein